MENVAKTTDKRMHQTPEGAGALGVDLQETEALAGPGNMRCCLVRNGRFIHTQLCFRPGLWTSDPEDAKVFKSRRAAEKFAVENGLSGYEIVLPPPEAGSASHEGQAEADTRMQRDKHGQDGRDCTRSTPAANRREAMPEIAPHRTENDASPFLEVLTSKRLHLIHIDNWFDHKWLAFSGKALGALGIWKKGDRLTVPPFVPSRVLAQQSWYHDPVSDSFRPESSQKIHLDVRSETNLQRRVSMVAPEAALIWYTGNTVENQRGAIMAYLPVDDGYWTWYVGLIGGEEWRVSDVKGITRDAFQALCS